MIERVERKISNSINENLQGVDPNLNLQGVDPNLNLPEDNIILPQPSQNNYLPVKKQIALDIFRCIIRNRGGNLDQNIMNDLILKINNGSYFYSLDDINSQNLNDLNLIYQQNIQKIEFPITLYLVDSLDYDIEFYKTGKTCNGLKKRKAIFKNGHFYSSKDPIEKFDVTKIKKNQDKTMYLNDATVYFENKNSDMKNKGEWSNNKKNYRVRINYKDPRISGKNLRSYFLYCENEEQMRDIEMVLFGLTMKATQKQYVNNILTSTSNSIIKGNLLYTILKILLVKDKIKKRKIMQKDISKGFKGQLMGKLSIDKKYLRQLSARRKAPEVPVTAPEVNNLRAVNIPPKKELELQISDYQPLIMGMTSNVNKESEEKKSLNNLLKKYKTFQKLMGELNSGNNLPKDSVALELKDGVSFENVSNCKDMKLDDVKCRDSKYIFVDRTKPEIQFKEYNDTNIKEKDNCLSMKDIYEISNVILNSGTDGNLEQNYLTIYGPKIDNNIPIEYKYKYLNNKFTDPELKKIKSQIINSNNIQNNINVIRLQIFHLEYEINENKLKELSGNLTCSSLDGLKESLLDPKNNLLMGYNINVSSLSHFDSDLKFPSVYHNSICITEFNSEHFIPIDSIESNKIIINFIASPTLAFSKKNIPEKSLKSIAKILSPIELGYAEIDLHSLKKGIYEYPLILGGQRIPNSKIVLVGFIEQINKNLPNLYNSGKNYAIGSDSYCTKEITKDFIDDAKKNDKISKEIKNKYFNVAFDEELPANFLLRPNENWIENDFFESIIQNGVSDEDKSRIFNNKNFTYLPMCEKYENEQKIRESNLRTVANDELENIARDHQEGDWIYKLQKVPVKLLSKNLGITEEGNLYQYIYCNRECAAYNKAQLNCKCNNSLLSYQNPEIIIPINENDFNVLDKKELDYTNGFDNFQWKLGMKFDNELQMLSFLKLLKLARQEANCKMKNLNIDNKIDYSKLLNFNMNRMPENNSNENCNVNIECIEFRKEYELKNNYLLDFKILKVGNNDTTLLQRLDIPKYQYKNSLLEIPEIKKAYNQVMDSNGGDGRRYPFSSKAILSQNKFNNGRKKYKLGNMMSSFPASTNKSEIYAIEIYFRINTKIMYSFTTSKEEISKVINNKTCESLELPLYKDGENEEKIYGYIIADIWNSNFNEKSDKNQFMAKYLSSNITYLKNPTLLLNKKSNSNTFSDNSISNRQISGIVENNDDIFDNNNFGLYEPNVFRRKILKLLHDYNLNVDVTKLENYRDNNYKKDIELLYRILENKYVILPTFENFYSFDYRDIRKNFSQDINTNTYRKELALKLLRIRRHDEFMKIFCEKEWKLFFKKLDQNSETIDAIEQISKYTLIKTSEISNVFHKLVYLGIPMKYRLRIYKYLLQINELFDKTYKILSKTMDFQRCNQQEIFNYFVEQVYNSNEGSNIFSLIDNDINYLNYTSNSTIEDINNIKKIAKAFIKWTELDIRLEHSDKKKYIYFVGILSIIQKLKIYFKDDNEVFWILVGLSQFVAHFHQQNPLFTDETNYINIFGLVTKLILECHDKEIYNKFISLNFPPDYFFSQHLSTLYTDYFKGELMMRIFDILIFESAYKENYGDKLEYLRILCAIPVTLLEMSEKRILACESVSEIETMFNDLISHTLNVNKFIFKLKENVTKFYVVQNFWEKLFNNKGREWDSKRDKIQSLFYEHFDLIYQQNINYLEKIYKNSETNILSNFEKNYFDGLESKLNAIRILYNQGTPNFKDTNAVTGFDIHVSKLQSLENYNLDKFKLSLFFGDNEENNFSSIEKDIIYDKENRKIKNISELLFRQKFEGGKYLYLILKDENYLKICTFCYDISKFDPMKIDKISLESREDTNKYFIEIVIFKYITNLISNDDIDLYNTVFTAPEYIHSFEIEEQFASYKIASYSFNNKISMYIKMQNDSRNQIINNSNYDSILSNIFKKSNNYEIEPDKYNKVTTEKIIKINNNNIFYRNITEKITKILNNCLDQNILNLVLQWLNDTNISFEEMLYSLVLIDNSSSSINEKLFLLYSIAQTKDKLIFNNDDISIKKVKELIYALYKRFMIYFTKTDVEKIIDFILKDEKLFNIKYVFVYNQTNEKKIAEFIYDKDRYNPKIYNQNKKEFEILFDNIDKEFNLYLNHLNNHYNINSITTETLCFILIEILNQKNISDYIRSKFDNIKLVIEKDNIMYQRNFYITYNPLNIQENDFIKADENDINDKVLINEILNLELNNSYNVNNYITFDKFKDIFFKLPYLSDLFRVSYSYMSQNSTTLNKEFDNFKVSFEFDGNVYGVFYFPEQEENNSMNDSNAIHVIECKIKLSDTVDKIVKLIFDNLNNRFGKLTPNELMIKDFVKDPEKINCYVCKYFDMHRRREERIKEKIGFYDSLFSNVELKNSNMGEIVIELDINIFSMGSSRKPVLKEDGYCKVYYPFQGDFIWRKCKLRHRNTGDVNLVCTDYKTKYKLNKDDVVSSNNI